MDVNSGWYPDSIDPALQRYWDGTNWTPYTASRFSPEQPSILPYQEHQSHQLLKSGQFSAHEGLVGNISGAALQTTRASSIVGNLVWLVFAGFWLAIGYFVAGFLSCLSVVGIPFGIQAFKLGNYALWPFGRLVIERPGKDAGLSCLGNVLWFVLGGWWLALSHLLAGILLCLTIVGLPLGLACFKMAGLAIAPFGKQIVSRSQLATMHGVRILIQIN